MPPGALLNLRTSSSRTVCETRCEREERDPLWLKREAASAPCPLSQGSGMEEHQKSPHPHANCLLVCTRLTCKAEARPQTDGQRGPRLRPKASLCRAGCVEQTGRGWSSTEAQRENRGSPLLGEVASPSCLEMVRKCVQRRTHVRRSVTGQGRRALLRHVILSFAVNLTEHCI